MEFLVKFTYNRVHGNHFTENACTIEICSNMELQKLKDHPQLIQELTQTMELNAPGKVFRVEIISIEEL